MGTPFMTLDEVAAYLAMSDRQVKSLIRSGLLTPTEQGGGMAVPRTDVDALAVPMASHPVPARLARRRRQSRPWDDGSCLPMRAAAEAMGVTWNVACAEARAGRLDASKWRDRVTWVVTSDAVARWLAARDMNRTESTNGAANK